MKTTKQFIKYCLFNGLNTATHFGVLVVLVEWLHLGAVISSVVAFWVAATVGYVLSSKFVFETHGNRAVKRFVVYLNVAIGGFIINTSLMALLVGTYPDYYVLCQVASALVVLLWNFTMHKYFTFRVAKSAVKGRVRDDHRQ